MTALYKYRVYRYTREEEKGGLSKKTLVQEQLVVRKFALKIRWILTISGGKFWNSCPEGAVKTTKMESRRITTGLYRAIRCCCPEQQGWDQTSFSSPGALRKQKQEEEFLCGKEEFCRISVCRCQNSVLIIISLSPN